MKNDKILVLNKIGLWRIVSRLSCLGLASIFGTWFNNYSGKFIKFVDGIKGVNLPEATTNEYTLLQVTFTISLSIIVYRILLYNVKRNIVKVINKPKKVVAPKTRTPNHVEQRVATQMKFD